MVIIMKKIFLLLMSMFLMVGVSGCMNTNKYSKEDMEIKARLMQYAVDKYGGEYTEIYYQRAVDSTRSHTLCLEDKKGRIFNVYEEFNPEYRYDDYLECIVDDKLKDYLLDSLSDELSKDSIGILSVSYVFDDLQRIEEMSLKECMEEFNLSKLIFVYHFEGEKGSIVENCDTLLKVYQKLRDMNFRNIVFNVVVTSGDSSEVNSVLQNMRYEYTGSWYSCENVQEYISKSNPNLQTSEDLKCLVKE